MPEANALTFNLENKSHGEIEARRRELITKIAQDYKGYDDPDVPMDMLRELVVTTAMLRRKNAGPPKAKPLARGKAKATTDDLLI